MFERDADNFTIVSGVGDQIFGDVVAVVGGTCTTDVESVGLWKVLDF